MKKNIAVLGIATFSVLGLSLVASAATLTAEEREQRRLERQERIEERKEERQERMEDRKEQREERKEKRCENVNNRIDTRIQRYENNQQRHRDVFGKIVNRVESVIDKLKAKGADTSDLSSALSTMKDMIKDLESEHSEFIDELKETKNYECGSSEGKFREQLKEARGSLLEVRSKVVEIRKYYQTDVRPEIIELREELKSDDSDE